MNNFSLEKLKADLLLRASLDEIKNGEDVKKIRGALDDYPSSKMINAVNYLSSNILPAIKKKSGEKSADYIFFKEVVDLLLWSIIIKDRYDRVERRYINAKIDTELLKERLLLSETELNKYAIMEDVWLTEGMGLYMKAIAARAEGLLNRKKQ